MSPSVAFGTDIDERTEASELAATDVLTAPDIPWNLVIWNDPVNLMTYVTFVLQELFGYDEPTATTLMLQVHHEGKAIVSSGPKERMEHDTSRLHAYGLWASYQKDA